MVYTNFSRSESATKKEVGGRKKSAIIIGLDFNIRDLLPDTELTKDIAQYFIIWYGAGDFTQKMHAFAYILWQEIAADACIEAINHPADGSEGIL